MTPDQQINAQWQEITRMRMDQAAQRRTDAMAAGDEAAWNRAQKVWETAAKAWQEAVKEGAETDWHTVRNAAYARHTLRMRRDNT